MTSRVETVYRRIRFGDPIVVVSGLPRSGTSMAMKMLDVGGLPLVTDGVRTADEDNPKGYYEFEPVKDLKEQADKSWLREARGKGIKIISFLLDALPPEYNYKVLFMRRDLNEILASQTKMLDRRGEDSETEDQRMMELWEAHLERIFFQLRFRPWFETLELEYTQVLSEPGEQAERVARFVGKGLDVEKMARVADRSLYRNRAKQNGP
jgi:hypothetical protein